MSRTTRGVRTCGVWRVALAGDLGVVAVEAVGVDTGNGFPSKRE